MTTYSKDRKYRTDLHLIYRIRDGQMEALGLHETRESAERELAVINRDGSWRVVDVTCRGWGIIDVWESREAFDAFMGSRLQQALGELGDRGFPGPPDIKQFPVHHYNAP